MQLSAFKEVETKVLLGHPLSCAILHFLTPVLCQQADSLLFKQARLLSRDASAAGKHAETRIQEQELEIRKLHAQIEQLQASEHFLRAQA